MDQLKALFMAGPDAGFSAQEIFTNRVTELEAFVDAVGVMTAAATAADRSIDPHQPRRNVLAYYGLGGIGKTALSRELERRLGDGSLGEVTPGDRATIRVDLGEAGDFDIESYLLQLRLGLAALRPEWPAFDFLFALYWHRIHPTEPLPAFVHRTSALRRFGERFGVGEQMQDALDQIVQEVGLAWAPARIASKVVGLTHDRLSRSARYRRLVEQCPYFAPLVNAEPTEECLSYLPVLLSWELMGMDRPYLAVVFLDTFEAVTQRASRDVERLVQRMVFLMPNVLHVVTSRDRLDWADNAGAGVLDYVGPTRWPNLQTGAVDEPRQHLVGALSAEDCDSYLAGVLRDADGEPVLGSDIRGRIVRASEGLPLYLDVSVTHYLDLYATGQDITVANFGGPLSAVVVRIMRDLSQDERDLLRALSILDAFDPELAAAVSDSTDAVVRRFVNRPLVMHTDGPVWPYALHAQLRQTVQQIDHELRDAWSTREWTRTADRALAHLGTTAGRAMRESDRGLAVACFTQALRLAVQFGAWAPWLVDAAQFIADIGVWSALTPRLPAARAAPAASGFARGLMGVALRRSGSLADSVRAFDEALTVVDDLGARSFLHLHRAHSVRNSGRYDQAQPVYERMVRRGDRYADHARLQLADLHLLHGEFRRALAGVAELASPALLGEADRLRGHVLRFNGQLDEAELAYRRALDLGRRAAAPGLEAKALTNLAETLCWRSPADAAGVAEEAIEYNRALGNQLEVLKAYAALAVATPDPAAADRLVERALELVVSSGYRAGGIFALLARVFHQALASQVEPARATLARIEGIVEEIDVYRFCPTIVSWWLPEGGPGPSRAPADWLSGETDARRHWQGVLEGRRA